RLRLTASTMSAPEVLHFSINSGKSEGGCCPSPSITITALPWARSKPAQSANSFPKFLLNRTARRFDHIRASSLIFVHVSSGEPSSMRTTSNRHPISCNAVFRSDRSSLKCEPSLYSGMTTEINGAVSETSSIESRLSFLPIYSNAPEIFCYGLSPGGRSRILRRARDRPCLHLLRCRNGFALARAVGNAY